MTNWKGPLQRQSNFSNESSDSEGQENADWDIQIIRELRQVSLSRMRDTRLLMPTHMEFLIKTAFSYNTKAFERHLARDSEQPFVDEAKLEKKKYCSRAFEATMLNAWDALAHRSLLAKNSHRFVEAMLQKMVGDFSMRSVHHCRVKGSAFCVNVYELCNVIATTPCQQDENIRPAIAKWMDRA